MREKTCAPARAVALLLILVPAAAFGSNPFLGRWGVESFGQAADMIFEFTSDTEMLIASGEDTSPVQSYSVDFAAARLVIPTSDGADLELRYVFQGSDTFVLYMTEVLLDQMVEAFVASFPRDVNPLTNEVIAELRVSIRRVFEENPFMRGTRLR